VYGAGYCLELPSSPEEAESPSLASQSNH
jgi:hypothetical protein